VQEKLIKSKLRVQKHGEVFTPRKTVKKMLNSEGLKEACENLSTTFLEPAAGEGIFLVEVLESKLNIVCNNYNDHLKQYENYCLLALTTLYGIEKLEDNAQTCTMNIFQKFYESYQQQVVYHGGQVNKKILDSAKIIISSNIRQGDFLTGKSLDENILVFSEWKIKSLRKNSNNIKVQRTEYTLDDISKNRKNEVGNLINKGSGKFKQLSIFDDLDFQEESKNKKMRYTLVNISDVYKEETEEVYENEIF
jgi:hypothetical protein